METAINQDGIVTIAEIKSYHRGHWFAADTMRFFASRLPQTGIRQGDKAYFISSEQFRDFRGYVASRRYTVRVLDYKTGDIDTVGEFNKLTRTEARAALRRIIAGS